MDYTYRERHGEAIYRFKSLPSRRAGDGMLPSDFFRRNVVLSFQEDAIGIRLPHPSLPRLRGREGWGRRQHDVGLGLSAQRVDVSAIAEDPGGGPSQKYLKFSDQAIWLSLSVG